MIGHKNRVWIRSSCISEAAHQQENGNDPFGGGNQSTTFRNNSSFRSLVSASSNGRDDTTGDGDYGWGWVLCCLLHRDPNGDLKVLIEDEDCVDCNGITLVVRRELLEDGDNVLAVNSWTNADLDEVEGDDGFVEDGEPPEDMIELAHLHEPAVVHCLRRRYYADKIYTATGPILLAVNPFKSCRELYGDNLVFEYWNQGEGGGGGGSGKGLPPHVFKTADDAFRAMMTSLREDETAHHDGSGGHRRGSRQALKRPDQSILVSGESGSGKTVTTKHIMKYLAKVSEKKNKSMVTNITMPGLARPPLPRRASSRGQASNIENKVLQSNPILESFGNARTIRNDNSSRFGKFISLQFQSSGTLIGASINTYLLEKIRLISQSPGERNYHIFYEILAGASAFEREDYYLGDCTAEDFKMTCSEDGTIGRRDGVEDSDTYDELVAAFTTMDFTEEEEENIFIVTCALLHASNLTFLPVTTDESKIDVSNSNLQPTLSLLGVTGEAFNKALCHFTICAGKEKHVRTLSAQKASKGLEALIKATYSALFTFLVQKINSLINNSNPQSKQAAYVGVLDIFGFESFQHNSFEQLCINYCNEALQQQFNLFIFKNEQREYAREGIEWSFIEFPDNQDVLDLIDRNDRTNRGIIPILDDQCKAPNTNDNTFANHVYKTCQKQSRFIADPMQIGKKQFSVLHYAGIVEYGIEGFVEKNKDELPREACDLLSSSTKAFVRNLANIVRPPSVKNVKKRYTVGGQFTHQLKELRKRIDTTEPHYVRCLKPNDDLIPEHFVPVQIADQLRCAGVIEAVRVSRVGYPQRYAHSVFLNRYKVLYSTKKKGSHYKRSPKKECQNLIEALSSLIVQKTKHGDDATTADAKDAGIQMGATKVFLRSHAFETLESLRGEQMEVSSVVIQSLFRRFVARRDYREVIRAAIRIQCAIRRHCAVGKVEVMRRHHAATVIQTLYRLHVSQTRYVATHFMAVWCQKFQRGCKGREKYDALNRVRKSIVLQRCWRRYYYSVLYQKKLQSIGVLQRSVRCHMARKELRTLRMGAKDLQAIKSERDELRKLVDTYQRELEMVQKDAKNERDRVGMVLAKAEAGTTEEVEHWKTKAQNANAEMEETKQRTQKEVEQYKHEATQLQVRLEETEQELAETAAARKTAELVSKQCIEELHQQTKDLREQLDASTNHSNAVEQRAADSLAEIERLNQCLQDARRDAEEAVKALEEALVQTSAAVGNDDEREELTNEIERLQNELRHAEQSITEHRDRAAAAEQAAELSSQQVQAARDELEELKAQTQDFDSSKKTQDPEELQRVKLQCRKLSSLLSQTESELETSKREANRLRMELQQRPTSVKRSSDLTTELPSHHNSDNINTLSSLEDTHRAGRIPPPNQISPPLQPLQNTSPTLSDDFSNCDIIAKQSTVSFSTLTDNPDEVFKLRNQVERLAKRLDDSSIYSNQMAKDVHQVLIDNRELKMQVATLKQQVVVSDDGKQKNQNGGSGARRERRKKPPKMKCSLGGILNAYLKQSVIAQNGYGSLQY